MEIWTRSYNLGHFWTTLPKAENKRTIIIIMWYIYLAIIVALLLIYWWKHFARKPHPKFPPGPVGLPILGYVPIFQAKNIIEGLDESS